MKLKKRSATYQSLGFRLHFHSSMLSCVLWEARSLKTAFLKSPCPMASSYLLQIGGTGGRLGGMRKETILYLLLQCSRDGSGGRQV